VAGQVAVQAPQTVAQDAFVALEAALHGVAQTGGQGVRHGGRRMGHRGHGTRIRDWVGDAPARIDNAAIIY
jgi:hypothetical protein